MRLPLATERVSHHGGAGYKRRRLRTRNHNIYSDEDKAKALVVVAVTENVAESARLLNVPTQTVRDWAHGRGITQKAKTMAKYFSEQLSQDLEDILRLSLAQTKDNLKSGVVRQRELNEINRDSARNLMALNGIATETVENITPEQKLERLKAFKSKLDEDKIDGS